MAGLELPQADPAAKPNHAPAEYYYRIPVRPIYRSYPVYRPDKEPPGYLEELTRRKPEVLWDASSAHPKLETKSDWIAAGELVFDELILLGYGRLGPCSATNPFVREKSWYEKLGVPTTKNRLMPFYRYVIRRKGNVEVGALSFAMCHARILPDGTILKGAQGNFPFDKVFATDMLAPGGDQTDFRRLVRNLYSVPWLRPDPEAETLNLSLEEVAARLAAVPSGVLPRTGTGPWSPVQVPDLTGVKTRRYLDRTGLQRHRGPADMMRYAALNQGGEGYSTYGGRLINGETERYAPELLFRYSDEQLYALTLYLYSLKPPANPNLPRTPEQRRQVERG